jgi:hypothetical protein
MTLGCDELPFLETEQLAHGAIHVRLELRARTRAHM